MNPTLTAGTSGAGNMWGCGSKSSTNAQYPNACSPGDVNGDNPDIPQANEMQILVNAAP